MDPQQDAINRILTGVESIQTLTRETVEALQNTIVGRVAINKFKVQQEEFTIWSNKHDLCGIEYDAHLESIIIKARQGPVHGETIDAIRDWFRKIIGKVHQEDGVNLKTYQHKTFCLTSGKYRGSLKAPDSSIEDDESFLPLIVLEVAFSTTRKDLLEDAKAWLYGTDNITELVIAIDIKEQGGKNNNDTDNKEDSFWAYQTQRFFNVSRLMMPSPPILSDGTRIMETVCSWEPLQLKCGSAPGKHAIQTQRNFLPPCGLMYSPSANLFKKASLSNPCRARALSP
ncbi:hypothetical protein VTN96DRAFT_7807 [Rasamsonia emersonii]